MIGGSDIWAATLSIAGAYRLPQGCTNGQVAKWSATGWVCADDASAAYTAGTGLELTDDEFSLDRDYRLPQDCDLGDAVARVDSPFSLDGEWGCLTFAEAGQSCPAGHVVTGLSATGRLTCSAAAGGSAPKVWADSSTSVGVAGEMEIASVEVPAGTYAVIASVVVTGRSLDDNSVGYCSIDAANAYTGAILLAEAGDIGADEHVPLAGRATLSAPGAITLTCTESSP